MGIDGLELVVLALAAYRASRAVALDSITEPFREWADRRAAEKETIPAESLAELVSCGFCCSWWLAGFTYGTFVLVTDAEAPALIHVILWWAIAGAASLLIAIDSFLLREAPPGD